MEVIAPKLKVSTNDGEIFTVDFEVIKLSATIKHLLEDLDIPEVPRPEVPDEEAIPLPNVDGPVFRKVLEWAEHHKKDPLATKKDEGDVVSRFVMEITEWDKEFLKVPHGILFAIILAANYLEIRYLLDICCKTVAGMIKGKSVEAIRKEFNIINDFTPEEEEALRKENEWCEDRER